MRNYSSEAIVLKRRDYNEADRILTAYSKHFGKLTFIAKGVRKPKSRKRGALEVFSLIKFSAAKSHGWDILTETQLLNSYTSIRQDLKKLAVAYFFLETIDKLIHGEEENQNIYTLLAQYLSKLEIIGRGLKRLRENFIYECLVELGYWPSDKTLDYSDAVLEDILEKKLSSIRIGKLLQLQTTE